MATIQSRITFPIKKRSSVIRSKNINSEKCMSIEVLDSDEEIKKPSFITKANTVTPRKTSRISCDLDDSYITPPKQRRQTKNYSDDRENNLTPSTLLSKLGLNSSLGQDSEKQSRKKLFEANNEKYDNARRALHSAVPSNMPARDEELKSLREFIESHLENKSSGTLYISGPPGTGKTAALTKVLTELKNDSEYKSMYINCTSIKSAQTVYSKVAEEIGIKSAGKTEKSFLAAIDKYLSTNHKSIILVLDEIDQLDTRKQSVLYTIFEWPSKKNSRLILIGIANALDLTDRVLPRLQARCDLKPKLLHFAPYTKQQIVDIIIDRLTHANILEVFSATAIQMLAGKVSAVSGDVRRALDIARRVIELFLAEKREQRILQPTENNENQSLKSVGVEKVVSVLNDVYGTCQNLQQDVDESVPLQQKILLCCLILMLKKGKNKDITIGKLHEVYRKVCEKRNFSIIDQSEFVGLCSLLESRGMLKVHGKKEPRLNKVSLEWDEDEVASVLKDKQLMSAILQDESVLMKR